MTTSKDAEAILVAGKYMPSEWLTEHYEEIAAAADQLVESGDAAKILNRVRTGRGRPKLGQETGETKPRSVRFPEAVWKGLEAKAQAQGISVHAALRVAALEWLTNR